MAERQFELTVSVSPDARFAGAVRELAVHAAQHAGCAPAAAETFGRQVEQAVQASFVAAPADAVVPVILRRGDGPVEALVDSRTITVDP